MSRKIRIIVLALVAAAVAAPIAQAGNPKPADPLALSILRGKGYSPSQIAAMTKVSSPATRTADPLALSWLRGHGYSPSQITAMTGPVALPWLTPAERQYVDGIAAMTPAQIAAAFGREGGSSSLGRPKVDPLAASYLRGLGLSSNEVVDWTVGVCSHEVKPASCFAVFDRGAAAAQTTTSGGFDWTDAGIGAGATFGLVLLAVGLGFMLVMRFQRRHTRLA